MKMANISRSIGRFLYVILVLAYPLIEKVGIAYCLWQFVLMLVYWDDPNRHPGYHFIGAFILLTVLFVMVAYEGDEEKTNRGTVQKNHR
jgi:Uncharacterized KleE stable inheritance protein